MKQGKTVDIETTQKIMQIFRREREDMRPVIWPLAKVAEACRAEGVMDLNQQPVTRPLTHLICDEDEIITLSVAPYVQQGRYGMGTSYERWNYDGGQIEQGACYAFVRDEAYFKRFRSMWREMIKDRDIYPDDVIEETLLHCFAVQTIVKDPETHKAELDAIRMAVQLERYAFSPYTVFRERRSFSQVMNHVPARS